MAITALAAGLAPVVVVSGAQAYSVEATLHDLPIIITRNADWQNGQSSSIQAGLRALTSDPLLRENRQDTSLKFEEFGGGVTLVTVGSGRVDFDFCLGILSYYVTVTF